MASTGAVRIVLVFALTCCLVSSEELDRSNQRGVTLKRKNGSFVGKIPEEVRLRMREPVAPLVTGACLSGDEAKVCDNASLPLLVFVAGVEGSGHHMVSSLFGHVSSIALHSHFFPWQHIYDPDYDNTTLFYSIIEKELYEQRMENLLQFMDTTIKNKKLAAMVFASSFPMGQHSGTYATARPDLIDLKDFECKLYRIKFLVTRRHPLAAVMSVVRRFGSRVTQYDGLKRIPWDKKVGLDEKVLPYTVTARITEDNLIYINQQVRQLGCHQVHFLDYEKVMNKSTRRDSLRALATFLELSETATKVLLSTKLNPPSTKVAIPPHCTQCIEKTLYDFFEERKMMWPLLQPQ